MNMGSDELRPAWWRRVTFPPSSALGRWSLRTFLAFVLFLVVAQLPIFSIDPDAPVYANPWHYGSILLTLGFALATALTGIVAVVRRKERSVLVFTAIALTTALLVFAVADIRAP